MQNINVDINNHMIENDISLRKIQNEHKTIFYVFRWRNIA